jgi:hypothetical protein
MRKSLCMLLMLNSLLVHSQTQYDTLIRDYLQGKKEYLTLPGLAKMARERKDNKMAALIAEDYINNFIFRNEKKYFYNKENIYFIVQFSVDSSGKIATLFCKKSKAIDKLVSQEGFAERYVDFLIAKEEINPYFSKLRSMQEKPDWAELTTKIRRKYNILYADRTVLDGKIRWYEDEMDSSAVAGYYIEKYEKYGFDTGGWAKFAVNNVIYSFMFRHCSDSAGLKKALKWMKIVLESDPDNPSLIDTYANLLFKTGYRQQAIDFENKAVLHAPKDESIRMDWIKMQHDEPTW